jgi:hypothetical protein
MSASLPPPSPYLKAHAVDWVGWEDDAKGPAGAASELNR